MFLIQWREVVLLRLVGGDLTHPAKESCVSTSCLWWCNSLSEVKKYRALFTEATGSVFSVMKVGGPSWPVTAHRNLHVCLIYFGLKNEVAATQRCKQEVCLDHNVNCLNFSAHTIALWYDKQRTSPINNLGIQANLSIRTSDSKFSLPRWK